jgi:hypothetical protein
MNPRTIFFSASMSLLALAPGLSLANTTSLGTSKQRTAGGTNTLKFSVLNASSLPAAREVANSINGYGLAGVLARGYQVAVPAQLANEVQIRPWKEGEAKVLTARTGVAIANRLTALIASAQRLHDKAEISDQDLRNVQSLGSFVQYFTQNSQILAKNKVAVLLDQ